MLGISSLINVTIVGIFLEHFGHRSHLVFNVEQFVPCEVVTVLILGDSILFNSNVDLVIEFN